MKICPDCNWTLAAYGDSYYCQICGYLEPAEKTKPLEKKDTPIAEILKEITFSMDKIITTAVSAAATGGSIVVGGLTFSTWPAHDHGLPMEIMFPTNPGALEGAWG